MQYLIAIGLQQLLQLINQIPMSFEQTWFAIEIVVPLNIRLNQASTRTSRARP